MRLYKYGGLVLLPFILTIGCGKDHNSNTTIDEGAAGGSISVHVSDGDPKSRPIYTWSDGSLDITSTMAMEVKVARTSSSTPVWAVLSLDASQNSVQSPIQHDTTQAGTTRTANSELDLETNITYRVTVTKADHTFGYREFTVLP